MSLIECVLSAAAKEVGVTEVGGNNRGKRVEQYLASTGLGPGNPWCAAFVSFVLLEAGIDDGPRSADTWALEAWAKKHDCLYNESISNREQPKRGDIFLLLNSSNRPIHTGFVVDVKGDGTFTTIEGNTGIKSDTDGDGVARKLRRVFDCSFIRWIDGVKSDQSGKVKIFKNANGATVIIDGVSHSLKNLRVNGDSVEAIELIAEY